MILKSFVLIAATTALSGCLGDSDTAALIKSYDFKGYVDLASKDAGTETNMLARTRTISLTTVDNGTGGMVDEADVVSGDTAEGAAEVIVALAPLAAEDSTDVRKLASLSLTVGDATFAFENTPGVVAVVDNPDTDADETVIAVEPVNDFVTNTINLYQSVEGADEGTYDNSNGAFDAYKVVTVGTGEDATHTGYLAGAAALTYVSWGGWAIAEVNDAEAPAEDAVGGSDDATVGVFAAGYETPSASVPITGTAGYFGTSVGMLIGAAKTDRDLGVMSSVVADINFATGAVLFGSSGSSYDGLDFAVASTLADGAFTAAINEVNVLAGSTMTGDVAGRLYGGDASELGGTFAALHSELGTYIGSFGARDVAAPSGAFVSSSTPD